MTRTNLLLAMIGLMLAGCTGMPVQGVFPPPNGSSNAECQHVGDQDTGYVVNCARHNDDRNNEREILH